MDGKVEDAARSVEKALTDRQDVADILNKGLISAMDVVGERFGNGDIFIPQVLWSAKAMQAGMDLLKPHLGESDRGGRATVVIGTAKGDIHDIGKNLVAMMLEGAGYEVEDLGVDVEPARFVDTAAEKNGDVIAVSALLTTTMQSMREIVTLLKEKNLSTRVIIGGAPVDEAFCKEIGADAYGTDASDAVKKVRALVG
jgi:5-methyltetrahydrofolate--homocysteine methyltransferase